MTQKVIQFSILLKKIRKNYVKIYKKTIKNHKKLQKIEKKQQKSFPLFLGVF